MIVIILCIAQSNKVKYKNIMLKRYQTLGKVKIIKIFIILYNELIINNNIQMFSGTIKLRKLP